MLVLQKHFKSQDPSLPHLRLINCVRTSEGHAAQKKQGIVKAEASQWLNVVQCGGKQDRNRQK